MCVSVCGVCACGVCACVYLVCVSVCGVPVCGVCVSWGCMCLRVYLGGVFGGTAAHQATDAQEEGTAAGSESAGPHHASSAGVSHLPGTSRRKGCQDSGLLLLPTKHSDHQYLGSGMHGCEASSPCEPLAPGPASAAPPSRRHSQSSPGPQSPHTPSQGPRASSGASQFEGRKR